MDTCVLDFAWIRMKWYRNSDLSLGPSKYRYRDDNSRKPSSIEGRRTKKNIRHAFKERSCCKKSTCAKIHVTNPAPLPRFLPIATVKSKPLSGGGYPAPRFCECGAISCDARIMGSDARRRTAGPAEESKRFQPPESPDGR